MGARFAALIAMIAAFFVFAAAPATAASSSYPPDAADRNLNSGPGGWTAADNVEGSLACIPGVTCPTLTSTHSATGGIADSGHLRTELSGLLGLAATSTSVWTSAGFVYDGVDGAEPDNVELLLSRGADIAPILAVLGNDVAFSVNLRNLTDSTDLVVVPFTSLEGTGAFSPSATVQVDPSDLHVGDSYRIVITTRFDTGVELLPGGWVGYDDIELAASTDPSGPGGPDDPGGPGDPGDPGKPGKPGKPGTGGGKGDAAKVVGAVTGKATLKGNKLTFKVKCKRRNGPCKAKYDARLKKKGKKISSTKRARIKPGKAKKVKLRVKKAKFLKQIDKKGKVTIRTRAKVGKKKATRYKRVKVKTRG